MKSTGEVLGIGKTIEEAMFKGLAPRGSNVTLEQACRRLYDGQRSG
ncbi:MAG: hypothetical protein ACLRSW_01385 [Christensenellaceae bacterium]